MNPKTIAYQEMMNTLKEYFKNITIGTLSNPSDKKSPVFVNNELEVPRLLNMFTSSYLHQLEEEVKRLEYLKVEVGNYVQINSEIALLQEAIKEIKALQE